MKKLIIVTITVISMCLLAACGGNAISEDEMEKTVGNTVEGEKIVAKNLSHNVEEDYVQYDVFDFVKGTYYIYYFFDDKNDYEKSLKDYDEKKIILSDEDKLAIGVKDSSLEDELYDEKYSFVSGSTNYKIIK